MAQPTYTLEELSRKVDAISEFLNEKTDRNLLNLNTVGQVIINGKASIDLDNLSPVGQAKLGKTQIVETYQNGASWYRIYSDGWCEQGGNILVNGTKTLEFLKHFKNTNYNFFVQSTYAGQNTIVMVMNNTKSISSIQISPGYGNSGNSDWRACGYLANGQY